MSKISRSNKSAVIAPADVPSAPVRAVVRYGRRIARPIVLVPTTAKFSAYYSPFPPLCAHILLHLAPPYSLDPLPFLRLLLDRFLAHMFYCPLSSPISFIPVDLRWTRCDSETLFSPCVDAAW